MLAAQPMAVQTMDQPPFLWLVNMVVIWNRVRGKYAELVEQCTEWSMLTSANDLPEAASSRILP